MKFEELVEKAEAYRILSKAVKNCSSSTVEEIEHELQKEDMSLI